MTACLAAPGLHGPCRALLAGLRAADARAAWDEARVLERIAAEAAGEVPPAGAPAAGKGAAAGDPDAPPAAAARLLAEVAADAAGQAAADAASIAEAALAVARGALDSAELSCERDLAVARGKDVERLGACRVEAMEVHARLLEDVGLAQGAARVLGRCDDGDCERARSPGSLCLEARIAVAAGETERAGALLERCRRRLLEPSRDAEAEAARAALHREVLRTEDLIEPEAVRARDACVRRVRPWTVPDRVAWAGRLGPEVCGSEVESLGPEELIAQDAFRRRYGAATGKDLSSQLRSGEGGQEVVAWFAGPAGQSAQLAFRVALEGYCACLAPEGAAGSPP